MNMNEKLDLILLKLGEHSEILDEHGRKLDEHSEKFDQYGSTLTEHGGLLKALIYGQQELKADLDGVKLEVYKRFDELNGKQESFAVNQDDFEAKSELLASRTWKNESDIYRLKKIAGIS